MWSFSGSKTFKRCQRQWYFKNCLANARAKEPVRRKAYLMSKLQSISGWRGSLVDYVISNIIIPAVKANRQITLSQAKKAAGEIFERQLACAKDHRLHEPDFSPSQMGDGFAAFYCREYEGEIPEDEILQARVDVERALSNLFSMRDLCTQLKSANYLVSQRNLRFSHSGETVQAVPDMIAFYKDRPPLIVDWKVHAFGVRHAWLQLGIYALALMRCKPHRDFSKYLGQWQETDIQLLEVQLLTNQIRDYTLTEMQVDTVDAYIAESINEIMLAIGEDGKDKLVPADFLPAISPETCQRCAYRSMCWEVA